jgi:hypothetical protein
LEGFQVVIGHLLWTRVFATGAELVEDLREFKGRYDEQWLIERHGFRTPAQARAGSSRGLGELAIGPACRKVV